jgi:hypothetical protein
MTRSQGRRGLGPHLDDDASTDLLQGYLSLAEQDAAFEHMRHCPACEEAVRSRAAELERLEVRGIPSPARRRRLDGRAWIPWAAAAAVVLVAVVSLIAPARKASTPESAGWLPAATDLSVLRAGSADAHLIQGLEAYERRDLVNAIAKLRVPQPGGPYGPYERLRRVYLGSALAAAGEHAEAVNVIQSVTALTTLPDPWKHELLWAYYVSLQNSGNRLTADSLIRMLAAEPGAVGDRARSLR